MPEYQKLQELDGTYEPYSGQCAPKQLARIASAAKRLAQADECAKRAEDHRIQQQTLRQAARVTNATEESLWLAFQGARLNLAAAVLLFLTLAATAWAAFAASEATRLAKRSEKDAAASLDLARKSADAATSSAAAGHLLVSHAAEVAQTQLRPWVSLRGVTICNVADPINYDGAATGAEITDAEKGCWVNYDYVNTGPTPALNVIVSFNLEFSSYPLRKKLKRPLSSVNASKATILPGLGQHKGLEMGRPFTAAEVDGLRNCTHAIYLYGWISYADTFGKRHKTRFRLYHNGHSGPVGVCTAMTLYAQGNQTT